MSTSASLQPAFAALDSCQTALEELEKLCCEPGRSPSMKALGATLAAARRELDGFDGTRDVLAHLEDAGAQIGRLQVGCCTPHRLPLYGTLLEGLTAAQLAINRELGGGH